LANNPETPETFHEVPASKYWYLGDSIGAVPKGFFKFWSPFLIITTAVSTVIACETDLWQRLIIALGTFFYIDKWFIGWPATFLTVGVSYLYLRHRSKQRQKARAEQIRIRRFQDAVITQNAAGVKKKK
jgi:hypothetical protein